MARKSQPHSLVPIETLLSGSWITLILLISLLTLPQGERMLLRHAEVLFAAFLTLLALRREARGLSLLLPFAAFTLTLFFETVLRSPAPRSPGWWSAVVTAQDLLKVLLVFGIFLLGMTHQGRGNR
ncbi:MAG: hypothetical protein V2A76_10050 [Planctomycetota bacterium]